jgi:hypothetical protein
LQDGLNSQNGTPWSARLVRALLPGEFSEKSWRRHKSGNKCRFRECERLMGEHNVEHQVDEKKSQAFMKALLEDLRALAFMLRMVELKVMCSESALSRRCS